MSDLKQVLTNALVHIMETTEFIEGNYPLIARSMTWKLHKKIEAEIIEGLKTALERAEDDAT